MRILIILSIVIFLVSCGKSETEFDTTIPVCIQNMLNDPTTENIKTVRVQNVNNELHYWLNTDFTEFDGTEFVVNTKCEVICSFCGQCIPLECTRNYDDNNWTVIWKR